MPVLGCVADDFTGATDVAGSLVFAGMRTLVVLDLEAGVMTGGYDALVVALKTRTAPVNEAIGHSLRALRWLLEQGCSKFYFKYCSTFDSRPSGNIGSVIDAFLDELKISVAIVCPANPENGRTVYQSCLFVNHQLLSESGMRNHPLTPMTDSHLGRLLAPQTRRTVGSVFLPAIKQGVQATRTALRVAHASGVQVAIADAIEQADLDTLACAGLDDTLLTGAAALAMGIPRALCAAGLWKRALPSRSKEKIEGASAIISGSCSLATQAQVDHVRSMLPAFQVTASSIAAGEITLEQIMSWAKPHIENGSRLLISATAGPEQLREAHSQFGAEKAALLVEEFLSAVAKVLVKGGVRKLIVTGGETSGAVVQALELKALEIGPRIDPGIHWSIGEGTCRLSLALKSGNFGTTDFLEKAWTYL